MEGESFATVLEFVWVFFVACVVALAECLVAVEMPGHVSSHRPPTSLLGCVTKNAAAADDDTHRCFSSFSL